MQLKVRSLSVFASSALLIVIGGGCGSTKIIGVNPDETGGSTTTLTDGGAGTGGASGVSGNTGGTSSMGGCSNTPVTFQVIPAPNSVTHWCVGQWTQNCYLGGIESIGTISNASGALQVRSLCTLSCGTCTFEGCPSPPECEYYELSDQGDTESWDGTYFTSSTCGPSAAACDLTNCASPGQYTYTVCAFPNPDPASSSTGCAQASSSINPTCIPVVFDYPTNAPMVVTLPDPVGGTTGCVQNATCVGLSQCTTSSGQTCRCNGGLYSCL